MDATNKEGSPKQLRGRSLGTKLGEAEYAQCEQAAARRGQSLSEWCRQVLLDAAVSPAQAPEAEAILSEVLALRKIVINRLYAQMAGEPLDRERMRELIESADAGKLAKAAERLRAVRTARAGASNDGAAPASPDPDHERALHAGVHRSVAQTLLRDSHRRPLEAAGDAGNHGSGAGAEAELFDTLAAEEDNEGEETL